MRRQARSLDIAFDSGENFEISAALLRAMTPSAAERGHRGGADQPLPRDFSAVALMDARPVGAYAVRLVFDDGHDSGIYTWPSLYAIGRDQVRLATEHRRLIDQA